MEKPIDEETPHPRQQSLRETPRRRTSGRQRSPERQNAVGEASAKQKVDVPRGNALHPQTWPPRTSTFGLGRAVLLWRQYDRGNRAVHLSLLSQKQFG